jgi:thymidine kinase
MPNAYLPYGHGWVEVITGPMFAGKTDEMIRRLKREVIAGKRIMTFKPDIDRRYADNCIVTHDGDEMVTNLVPCASPGRILDIVHPSCDVIGIDEAQFFDPEIVEVCEILANRKKRVVVAGVDMDYRCKPWSPMSDLMAVAEFVDKLTAVCFVCGKPATKIQRFTGDHLSTWDEETIIVGTKEGEQHHYEARCRGCYRTPPKLIRGGRK